MIVNLIVIRLLLKNRVYHWDTRYVNFKSEDWQAFVKEKVDLFLNHNLPSIEAQTNQDFDYLVLIDSDFPEYDCARGTIESQRHRFELRYTDVPWGDGNPSGGSDVFVPAMQKHIYDYVQEKYPECEWLTTQRIDSDDLICNDFVDCVMDRFEKREQWIIFETGYTYVKDNSPEWPGGVFTITDYQSPHPTYCEPFSENIKTVYHRMHNKLGVNRGTSMVLVPGGELTEKGYLVDPWTKGYWLDYAAFASNICKDPKRARRWRGYPEMNEDQWEDLKTNFILAPEILK